MHYNCLWADVRAQTHGEYHFHLEKFFSVIERGFSTYRLFFALQ